MKTKRFSLGVKIASILSAVAILSVGFANWLIVNIQPEETISQAGSFTVYQVEDKSVTYTPTWENATIIFGALSAEEENQVTGNVWFKPNGLSATNLVATLELTITNVSQLSSFDITFAPADTTKFDAVLDTSIAKPVIKWYTGTDSTKVEQGSVTYESTSVKLSMPVGADKIVGDSANNDTATVTVEFIFAWGTDFGGVNPYVHFNNTMQYSAGNATLVTNKMNALYALNAMNYAVTLTPVANGN